MEKRKDQIYIENGEVNSFIHQIENMILIYNKRLKLAISNAPEEESKLYENALWIERMNSIGYPEIDENIIADEVLAEAYDYYTMLKICNYRILAMWICCLCEIWEQQIYTFITKEEKIKSCTLKYVKLNDNYYFNVVKEYKRFGIDFDNMDCVEDIHEMRLLVNTIKHTDGKSKDKLMQLKPNILTGNDLSPGANTTIIYESLNICEDDLYRYAKALIGFWSSVPTNQWLIDLED